MHSNAEADDKEQAMEEIHKLRGQISSIVQTNFPETDSGFVANLRPPNSLQVQMIVFRVRDRITDFTFHSSKCCDSLLRPVSSTR